jgi:hypothetical protein
MLQVVVEASRQTVLDFLAELLSLVGGVEIRRIWMVLDFSAELVSLDGIEIRRIEEGKDFSRRVGRCWEEIHTWGSADTFWEGADTFK